MKIGHNKIELRVVALRRSGHHGIVNWLGSHFENAHWLNCIRIPETSEGGTIYIPRNMKRYAEFRGCFRPISSPLSPKQYHDIIEMDKNCLIHNYENKSLEGVQKCFDKQNNGNSDRIVTIIVVRDPYNLAASRACRYKYKTSEDYAACSDAMKAYYYECLGETNILAGEKFVINYNRWFSDIEYRRSISKYFGLAFTDRGLQYIVRVSSSSFDQLNYNHRAQEMDVLNRWKTKRHDPLMQELFKDKELERLSKSLFGFGACSLLNDQ